MTDLRSNDTYLAGFVLSIFVLGYAVGPLLISPLSELYGRVPLYHICNILFTLCTLFAGRATNPQVLATLRFFAGVGGSSVFALAPSSLADMVAREKRGAALAFIAIGYNLGPALAPTAGSYVNDAWGWRWIFYVTGILGAGVTVLNAVCLSESYEPVLLRRKNACSPIHVDTVAAFRKAMFMPTYMLFSSPSIFLVSLLTAVGYGYVYILYTTLPTTILTSYAWAPKRIGLAYLGTAVGNFFGMGKLDKGIYAGHVLTLCSSCCRMYQRRHHEAEGEERKHSSREQIATHGLLLALSEHRLVRVCVDCAE